jgi:hypothetical protein
MPFDSAPTAPETRTAEVLRTAVQILRTYGWVQHGYGDASSGFCLLGAINVAITGSRSMLTPADDGFHEAIHIARQVAATMAKLGLGEIKDPQPFGPSRLPPHSWNDLPGRTRAEVIDLLEKTADAV